MTKKERSKIYEKYYRKSYDRKHGYKTRKSLLQRLWR